MSNKFQATSPRLEAEINSLRQGSDEWLRAIEAYDRFKITDPLRDILYNHGLVNNHAPQESIIEYIDYLLENK